MRQLKKLPRNKCWLVGYSKAEADAMEIAREFNKEWETNLRIGLHDCRRRVRRRRRQRFGEVRLDQAARRLEGSEETKRLKLRRDNASRGIVASRAFASFEVKKKKKKKRE